MNCVALKSRFLVSIDATHATKLCQNRLGCPRPVRILALVSHLMN
jgi:hypothetical protein